MNLRLKFLPRKHGMFLCAPRGFIFYEISICISIKYGQHPDIIVGDSSGFCNSIEQMINEISHF